MKKNTGFDFEMPEEITQIPLSELLRIKARVIFSEAVSTYLKNTLIVFCSF